MTDKKFVKRVPLIMPTPRSAEEAIQNFSNEWCKNCGLRSTLTDENPKPLCPKELLDTCPIYKTYLSYKAKKEGTLNATTEPNSL